MPRAGSMLKVMIIVLAVLVVLIIGLGVFVVSQLGVDRTPVELALRLEPGGSYALRIEAETEGESTVDGRGSPETSREILEYTWTVREVDEQGVATVDVTCDRVQLWRGGLEYDSSRSENEKAGMLTTAAEQYERDFTLRLSPKGRVLEIELSPDEESEADTSAGMDLSQLPAEFREQMEAQFGDMAGDMAAQGLKMAIEDVLDMYPDGQVSVGSEWKARMPDLPVEIAPEQVPAYRMTDRRDGVVVIKLDFELDEEATETAGPVPVEGEGSVDASAVYRLDEKTGCILEGSRKTSAAGSAKMAGQEIEFSVNSTRKVSLTPKDG